MPHRNQLTGYFVAIAGRIYLRITNQNPMFFILPWAQSTTSLNVHQVITSLSARKHPGTTSLMIYPDTMPGPATRNPLSVLPVASTLALVVEIAYSNYGSFIDF